MSWKEQSKKVVKTSGNEIKLFFVLSSLLFFALFHFVLFWFEYLNFGQSFIKNRGSGLENTDLLQLFCERTHCAIF